MVKTEIIIEKLKSKLGILLELKNSCEEDSSFPNEYKKTILSISAIIKNVEDDRAATDFSIFLRNTRGAYTKVRGTPIPPNKKSNYLAQLQAAISLTECKIEEYEMFDPLLSKNETTIVPKLFLSKSFNEKDVGFNKFIEDILTTLKIPYTTGKKYSSDSIPKKIETRIDNSDLLLVLAVKRDEKDNSSFTIPPWINREMFYAKGKGKDYIVMQEEGTEEIPGLRGEKEIFYFKRDSISSIQNLVIKLLEAFKQHGLI